ncbi:alpha/beta hydrolase-fold protein [Kitasatospora sp. NBC_01287]|uniref:alpha/beta hydrolase n=1 Tax=Kitasatospora sp. NBC_01287 TaxID=2903573 RepID=UPI002255F3F3|nr:alpha/beta hydrolase-fold protein [Kitasatospora sp. NBC_01287]MCX4747377.1 alpha/beta hydrolase-fold protein [Kitasatospora sp. NBC_01287]
MELTSSVLVYAVAALAALALLATLWLWPRLSRQRPLSLLGRLGLLMLTQLAVLAVCGLSVNNAYGFYTSWRDLLAPDSSKLALAPAQGGGKGGPPNGGALVQPADDAGLAGLTDLPQGRPEEVGRVDSIRVSGKATGLSDQMFIYLPPEYFNPKYARERFPVLLTLTGFPGPSLTLLSDLHTPQTVWDLQRTGKMAPTIVLMARPTVAAPRNTECVDVPGGPQSETWFAKDVPTALRSAYRVSRSPGSWGVLGYSTGGSCALRLALRDPDAYGSATALHADYQVSGDWSSGDLFNGNQQLAQSYDLGWRLRSQPPPKSALMVISTKTEEDYAATEQFLAEARTVTAAHPEFTVDSLILPDGGHTFDTWLRELPAALEWSGDHLAPPPDREPRA